MRCVITSCTIALNSGCSVELPELGRKLLFHLLAARDTRCALPLSVIPRLAIKAVKRAHLPVGGHQVHAQRSAQAAAMDGAENSFMKQNCLHIFFGLKCRHIIIALSAFNLSSQKVFTKFYVAASHYRGGEFASHGLVQAVAVKPGHGGPGNPLGYGLGFHFGGYVSGGTVVDYVALPTCAKRHCRAAAGSTSRSMPFTGPK